MAHTQMETEPEHGTIPIPAESVKSRSVRIRSPLADVQRAWNSAELPGTANFENAPEGRGVNVTVDVDRDTDKDTDDLLSAYDGESMEEKLESALRRFKALLETGEVATTEGQSSGREST